MPLPFPLKKPAALHQGDTIAIVAPASPFDPTAFLQGVERIKTWGFRVKYREDIFAKKRYLAGDDARRLSELSEYLLDEEVKAIFTARGGYGSMRLLSGLDSLPRDLPPKILLGYSDFTSILMYALQAWNWVTFHGPVVAKDISARVSTQGETSLLRTLTDPRPLGRVSPPGLIPLHNGVAKGRLVGGCLSLIVCSLGTPYQLKTKDCVLYLEDVGEILYSLDRMLTHLRLAGLFQGIRGILFGPLKDAHDEPQVIAEVLRELLGDLKVPILFGFPSGHMEDSWTMPLGLPVTVDADQGALVFEEGALKE
jgi:muramoyltetrapeptide carboxypeptidase